MFIVRLVIAFAGGLVALAMVLTLLAFLLGDPPASRSQSADRSESLASALVRRSAAREDFERAGQNGVIVPVSAAAEVLNQCSRETVSPIEGYFRPTQSMVAELESRLGAFLTYESRLLPLDRYVRQYAGVVSLGQPLVYTSFLVDPLGEWERKVVVLCDGGNLAWGVAFDVERNTFGEVRVNGGKGQ